MKWTAPPTRREISLVLFSLTIFVLSYNLESTLTLLGLNPSVSPRLWTGHTTVIDNDGRKPGPWRDGLENFIYGDWRWDKGHVSGNGKERQQEKGGNRYGAIWTGETFSGTQAEKEKYGSILADGGVTFWGGNVPETKLVAHVPGYTILDSVIILNGTINIITDDPSSFPSLQAMGSSSQNTENPPSEADWQIWSTDRARDILASHIGNIEGVTLISTDPTYHNHTLLSLWRTYTSLDPSITALGESILPPPRRLFFPHIASFRDSKPEDLSDLRRRVRSYAGFHPLLAKTAFPTLGLMFSQDWSDYARLGLPFRFERVVIADRGAASRTSDTLDAPVFAGPFERLEGSRYWWEPVRQALVDYLNAEVDGKGKSRKAITYVSRQAETDGPRLRDQDHRALINALRQLERDHGYELYVVDDREMKWDKMMTAIVKSTVMIGVFGPHLTDSVFLKPSPQTTLMEFFPEGSFSRDQELPTRFLGNQYIAWWNNQKFSGVTLPAVRTVNYDRLHEIPIDVSAVVQSIRETLQT